MLLAQTGTLTEDGLDLYGVIPCSDATLASTLVTDCALLTSCDTRLLHAMATCHSLAIINDDVIGDPLDLKMFEATGWVCGSSILYELKLCRYHAHFYSAY